MRDDRIRNIFFNNCNCDALSVIMICMPLLLFISSIGVSTMLFDTLQVNVENSDMGDQDAEEKNEKTIDNTEDKFFEEGFSKKHISERIFILRSKDFGIQNPNMEIFTPPPEYS